MFTAQWQAVFFQVGPVVYVIRLTPAEKLINEVQISK